MKYFTDYERVYQFFSEQDLDRLEFNWLDTEENSHLLQDIAYMYAKEVLMNPNGIDEESAKAFGYVMMGFMYKAFIGAAEHEIKNEDYT